MQRIDRERSEIAAALRETMISPNVPDNNFEAANIVDSVDMLGRRILGAAKHLGNGNATTDMGALEAHGKAMLDSAEKIASAINNLADAIERWHETT